MNFLIKLLELILSEELLKDVDKKAQNVNVWIAGIGIAIFLNTCHLLLLKVR